MCEMMDTSTSRSTWVACSGSLQGNTGDKTTKAKMKTKWKGPIVTKYFREKEDWKKTQNKSMYK